MIEYVKKLRSMGEKVIGVSSEGCILVGELLSKNRGIIQKSADTFRRVFGDIRSYYRNMEDVSITITHRTYEEYQRQEGK